MAFTGRLTVTVNLDLQESDADLLAANLQALLEERLAYVDVQSYTIDVERYSS